MALRFPSATPSPNTLLLLSLFYFLLIVFTHIWKILLIFLLAKNKFSHQNTASWGRKDVLWTAVFRALRRVPQTLVKPNCLAEYDWLHRCFALLVWPGISTKSKLRSSAIQARITEVLLGADTMDSAGSAGLWWSACSTLLFNGATSAWRL